MDARSLRISNLVLFAEDQSVFTVKEISEEGLWVFNEDETTWIEIDQFEGIPLTEGWLLKLGAKKNGILLWLSLTNFKAEIHFEIYGKEIVSIIKSNFCELILDPIKSVHQLQNLYFALTGEELTIKND